MILTSNPAALPGSCYLCGSGVRDSFVDLGVSVEFHGAMYLCNECVAEMAHLMGFTTPEQTKALTDKIEELETELFRAQTRAAGLERANSGLLDAGYCSDPITHLHPDNRPRISEDPTGSTAGDRADEAGSSVREDGLAGGEGETSEPLHDEGVAELRSDVRSVSDSEFSFDL